MKYIIVFNHINMKTATHKIIFGSLGKNWNKNCVGT